MQGMVELKAVDITSENFKPFGQIITPIDDGVPYRPEMEPRLELDRGTPRFYIMRLPRRGRTFSKITYHGQVTQCLGSLSPPQNWFLVVAAPTMDVSAWPRREDLVAFRIPHGVIVKLHVGTWHAGPLGDWDDDMDFLNLELSDTNVVDHNTHNYSQSSESDFAFQVID